MIDKSSGEAQRRVNQALSSAASGQGMNSYEGKPKDLPGGDLAIIGDGDNWWFPDEGGMGTAAQGEMRRRDEEDDDDGIGGCIYGSPDPGKDL